MLILSAALYFEVRLNVSLTGDCDAEQTLSSWVCLTEYQSSFNFRNAKQMYLH